MAGNRRKTTYFFVRPGDEWATGVASDVAFSEPDGALTLRPILEPFTPDPTLGGLDVPTGIAVAADGTVFVIDGARHLLYRRDPCDGHCEAAPCFGGRGAGARQLCDPHGLAIDETGNLYIADTGNHRIVVVSRKGWAVRRLVGAVDGDGNPIASELPGGLCRPWDLAIGPRGLVVVDRGNRRVELFERAARRHIATLIGPDLLGDPMHVAIDRSGRIYIADRDRDRLLVFDGDGAPLAEIEYPATVRGRFEPGPLACADDGTLWLLDPRAGRAARVRHDHRGLAVLTTAETPAARCLCSGAGNPTLAGASGIYPLDPASGGYEVDGTWSSTPLDSRSLETVWHKLVVDAAIPEGTSVTVWVGTQEPASAAGGADITAAVWGPPVTLDQGSASSRRELLVLAPPGRYAWIKLELHGSGRATPRVSSIEVLFPRPSLLRFLPAVYQEDEVSRDQTDRFLALFERFFTDLDVRSRQSWRYFNPYTTDPDLLPWLATWVGAVLEASWPLERKRAAIARSAELFRGRGTRAALAEALGFELGAPPPIVEHFGYRRWMFLGERRLGCSSMLWGSGFAPRGQIGYSTRAGEFAPIGVGVPRLDPFRIFANRFSVYVPAAVMSDEERAASVRRIVERGKPAQAQAHIVSVRARMRVGVQSSIGVDAVVGCYPRFQLGESELGASTILGGGEISSAPPSLLVGRTTRLGSAAVID